MRSHRLIVAVFLVLSAARYASGVEAITNFDDQRRRSEAAEAARKMVEHLTAQIANQRNLIKELGKNPKLPEAYKTLLSTWDAEVKTGPANRVPGLPMPAPGDLLPDQLVLVEGLNLALLNLESYQQQLKEAEEQKYHLESLTMLAPAFSINTGDATSAYVPEINFLGDAELTKFLRLQYLVTLRPDPPAGTGEDVAQSIRVNTGVVNANLGFLFGYCWVPGDDKHGSIAIDARLGLPVSYQRTSETVPVADPSSPSTIETSNFGLFSPELKVTLWLKFVLLGYKLNHYLAFGKKTPVNAELDGTTSHKAYMACRIDKLSGKDSDPFYLEANYTGGKNTFSGGTFSIGVSKTISW
jgi:hypothetical protein